jgi:hypothetical protein
VAVDGKIGRSKIGRLENWKIRKIGAKKIKAL